MSFWAKYIENPRDFQNSFLGRYHFIRLKMPKKKTGQRKKHDKMKARQKEIGKLGTKDHLAIVERPCNFTMECDKCQRRQKNRAFCYFCQSVSAKVKMDKFNILPPQVQRLPVCAECGKQKCMSQGDCIVKHVGNIPSSKCNEPGQLKAGCLSRHEAKSLCCPVLQEPTPRG